MNITETKMKLEQESKIEVKVSNETKRQLRLEGSLMPHKGHKVFRKHKVTGIVEEVELDFQQFSFNHYLKNKNALIQGKIKDNGNYIYGTFLNLQNAKLKL